MGAENGGQSAQGPGLQRAVLKDPGVSAVLEGLGQLGQVALGGSFHCWAGLDGFWGLFLSQELRGVTPRIRSAGGLEGPAPAPCVRDGFGPACSSAPQALCGLGAPPAEGAMGPREGTSQALHAAAPHPLLPVWGADHTQHLSSVRARQPEGCAGATAGGCTELGKASEDGTGPGVRSASWRGPGPLGGREGRIRTPSTQTPEPPPASFPTSHSLSDELDGVLVLHPTLDEGQRHEDWSPRRTAGPGHPGPGTHPFPNTFTLGAWGGPGFPNFLPTPMEGTGSSCTCCVTSGGQGTSLCPRLLMYKCVGGRVEGGRPKCWAQVWPWMRA